MITSLQIGIECVIHDWSDLISGEAFLDRLAQLNSDTETEAILVQFPVKEGFLQADLIMEKIDPLKDVDGFHPLNMTRLYQDWGFHYESCTAKGILRLLGELNIPLEGQPVCVIGKSRVVGLPLVNMLLRRGSTVTVCHTQTKNLPEIIKQHSIVVVAIGQPRFIQASWIKPQAVIVDVGINIDPMTGKICGDVDYEEARKVASFITPVPGGIGPLTIAMLAENVLLAHLQKLKSGLI